MAMSRFAKASYGRRDRTATELMRRSIFRSTKNVIDARAELDATQESVRAALAKYVRPQDFRACRNRPGAALVAVRVTRPWMRSKESASISITLLQSTIISSELRFCACSRACRREGAGCWVLFRPNRCRRRLLQRQRSGEFTIDESVVSSRPSAVWPTAIGSSSPFPEMAVESVEDSWYRSRESIGQWKSAKARNPGSRVNQRVGTPCRSVKPRQAGFRGRPRKQRDRRAKAFDGRLRLLLHVLGTERDTPATSEMTRTTTSPGRTKPACKRYGSTGKAGSTPTTCPPPAHTIHAFPELLESCRNALRAS